MKKFIYLYKNKSNKKFVFNKIGDYIVFFNNSTGVYDFIINNENINLNIYGVYMGRKNEKFNITTNQIHKKPNSRSYLFIKGIFDDKAQFNFKGLIRIEKKANKSIAFQKNQNLNLSDNTQIESKPDLEILTDDVYCTHAATTSTLNNKSINYLNSRSINFEKSRKLLTSGFIKEVVNKIEDNLNEKEIKNIYSQIKNFLL
jgi:Fe-S cluster assembly protein SufD